MPFPREHLFQTALFEPFQLLDFARLQFDGLVLRGENFGNLLLLPDRGKNTRNRRKRIPIQALSEIRHAIGLPVDHADHARRFHIVVHERRVHFAIGLGYDVSRADHALCAHSANGTLPCTHHVENQISRCRALVLRLVLNALHFLGQLVLIQFAIGHTGMNGHREKWQAFVAGFPAFGVNVPETGGSPGGWGDS